MISGGGQNVARRSWNTVALFLGGFEQFGVYETTHSSEVLTNECTNTHFLMRKLERADRRCFTKPPPAFIIWASAKACEACLNPPFFYHWIDTGRADFIWDGGSGPSGCLLLPSYEAYLSEEPA